MEISAQYLAGFFDGEGTITAMGQQCQYKSGYRYFQTILRISLCNTNLEILEAIQQQYGGKIYRCCSSKLTKNPTWKASYSLEFRQQGEAKRILLTLAPYVHVKKPQVDYILANWPLDTTDMKGITEEERAARMKTVEVVREMNRRGNGSDKEIVQ